MSHSLLDEMPTAMEKSKEKVCPIALARELNQTFRSRAAELDRDGQFSIENYRLSHENTYAAATVPQEFGGHGVDALTLAKMQEELGRGCAGTALGLSMHLSIVGMISGVIKPHQGGGNFLRRIVDEKISLGGGGSEEISGGDYDSMGTFAEKVPGGYRVNGKKKFASGCLAADYLFHFIRTSKGKLANFGISAFLIRRDSPGVIIRETWDAMGMRASGSHEVVLENVFVPEDYLVGTPDRSFVECIPYTYYFLVAQLAIYLGIATESIDVAVTLLRTRAEKAGQKFEPGPETLMVLGEAISKLEASRAFLHEISAELSTPHGKKTGYTSELLARGAMAKAFGMKTCVEVVDAAVTIAGSIAYSRKFPLERHYRDVRAGAFHPPRNFPTALEMAGRYASAQSARKNRD